MGQRNPDHRRREPQAKARHAGGTINFGTTIMQFHDRLMNAKTPEERNALMADQMKALKEGMSMMHGMAGGGIMDGSSKGNQAASLQATLIDVVWRAQEWK